jgi:hypothetical protein|tara:strand:- start:147 stop:623 length:477 start_codon:yes stop_codon:yes gene_type:complete
MIEIKITDEMFLEAREKAISLGQLHNSITRGSGNLAGFIGEILVRTHFNYTEENTYDYDLVTEDGRKIDVKTKQTTVVPKSNYDCSISASNTKQKCDEYIFVRVKSDFSVGWILGRYNKAEYLSEAVFMKKGEVDPDNNFKVRADCYNMKINQLKECL